VAQQTAPPQLEQMIELPPEENVDRPTDKLLRIPEKLTQNLGFLQGCWITDRFKHSPTDEVGTSTYCFDTRGRGTLFYQNSIYSCRLEARADFKDNKLNLVDSDGRCSNGLPWFADHLDCQRGADDVAYCSGISEITPRWTVTLHRKKADR